jgi:nucleotide-binding universal stress UspA family protein
MKTILVATDLAIPSENAARYTLGLAKKIKADILLCNAIKVDRQAALFFQPRMPIQNYLAQKNAIDLQLGFLANKLRADIDTTVRSYIPIISCTSRTGSITEVLREVQEEQKIDMVVMGMYGAPEISKLLLGSKTAAMLEKINLPLLLVPFSMFSSQLNHVAFASELCEHEMPAIAFLLEIVRAYSATLSIVHIIKDDHVDHQRQNQVDDFFNRVSAMANYSKINLKQIKNTEIDAGLKQLGKHGAIEMLAMVHHRDSILKRIFTIGHAQKMASNSSIPLLVFPATE